MRTAVPFALSGALLLVCGPAGGQTPPPDASARTKAASPKAKTGPPGSAEPATDREKILYTMGAMLGFPVSSLELSEAEIGWIRQGLSDSASGRPLRVPAASWMPQVSDFTRNRLADVALLQKSKDAAFFQQEAARPGTVHHPSGLLYRETRTGARPGPGRAGKVFVAYTGMLPDGTVFDSSSPVGRPVVFDLDKVLPCWQTALPLMKAGGKARVVCPPELAWGDVGNPPLVKPGATVVFDLELVEVLK